MASGDLFEQLRGNWGWMALRGVVAVLFGVLAFTWPGVTLVVLTLLWGAYALADGAFSLIASFRLREQGKPMWALALIGVLGIVAGIVTFLWPGMTALALLVFIAVWAILMGIFQIIAAIRVRKDIDHEWLLVLAGALSVAFGVLLVANPGAGALAVVWLIGAYAIVFGVLLVGFALRLRKLGPSDRAGLLHRPA